MVAVISFLVCFTSCGQENKPETTMQTSDTTIQDFLDLYKTVEHYEVKPYIG